MDIIEATEDRHLFKPFFREPESWVAWRSFLKALYALPMDEGDAETYRECTERKDAPAAAFNEAWLICGRRAGKSRILALLATYIALFNDWRPYLSAGERGYVVVVAADRKQSRTIMNYIRAFIMETPLLKARMQREVQEALDLTQHVSIEVVTCSYKTIRGRTVIAALCDEIAFWSTEDGSENPDTAVLAALRPAMATIPNAMLFAASSPYARRGSLWDTHKRYFGQDDRNVLVWQAATKRMNPTISQAFLDQEYEKDAISASAEYGALFRTDIEAWITREVIDACTIGGLHERPYNSRYQYVAFCDPSGGSADSMTLAIAHAEGKQAILDLTREVKPPFQPDSVVMEFAKTLAGYQLHKVQGDKYAGLWPRERFAVHGVIYEPTEKKTKSDIYGELLPLLNSHRVDLLDDKRLAQQFVGLERRTARSGKDSVDHGPGLHDDLANAAAGALTLVTEGGANIAMWIKLGGGGGPGGNLGNQPPTIM